MKLLEKIRSLSGLWWISWFGIIGGFFLVGGWEFKRELDQGGAASHFSLALLILIALSWSAFFVVDGRAQKREPRVVNVFTVIGTLLAIFTLLGIFYFVKIAPRVG
jgi:drug/metabolite transporter (DMT)-like permease